MASKRRVFKRLLGKRPYRKLFVVATEGIKTEPDYFVIFDDHQNIIKVKCVKGDQKSAPEKVLKRMTDYLKEEHLKKTDEAWLVVDKDQWTDIQLMELHEWVQQANNRGLALSNPNFEFWLLLHFEDGNKIESAKACLRRLTRHLPNYNKGIDTRLFTQQNIVDAIHRAKIKDNPRCKDWPRNPGRTTVYRLVENILNTGK